MSIAWAVDDNEKEGEKMASYMVAVDRPSCMMYEGTTLRLCPVGRDRLHQRVDLMEVACDWTGAGDPLALFLKLEAEREELNLLD